MRKSNLVIVFVIVAILLPGAILAKARVPVAPPTGQSWVWVEAHWELVPAPPPGPYQWRDGFWDTRAGIWVPGAWIQIKVKRGYDWSPAYYDDVRGIWISGRWILPKKGRTVGPGMVQPGGPTDKPGYLGGPGNRSGQRTQGQTKTQGNQMGGQQSGQMGGQQGNQQGTGQKKQGQSQQSGQMGKQESGQQGMSQQQGQQNQNKSKTPKKTATPTQNQ